MKKFILSIIAVLFCTASFAQGSWDIDYHEADELKGIEGYYSNFYMDDSHNAFVCWNNDKDIKICSSKGIFDYKDSYVTVIVGFYDESNKLIDKVVTQFFVPKGDSDTAYTSKYKSKALGLRIINHLKNVGSVRFIASKYSGADFDLIVPKNPDLKVGDSDIKLSTEEFLDSIK